MSEQEAETQVREVIGVFADASHLRAALVELESAGFERERIGLLASEYAVERSLGDLYARVKELQDASKAPAMAFVEADSRGDTARSMGGGLFFVGSTAVLGAAVASAAALGGALLPALAGAATVGAVGALLGGVIRQSDAEYLESEVDKGHLLLFVRADDPGRETEASRILLRHSARDVRVHEVPLRPADGSRSQRTGKS